MIAGAPGLAEVCMLMTIPDPGGYLAGWKIILMLVLVLPWLTVAPWVQRDEKVVRAPQYLWSAIVLACGALGIVLWLAIPVYVLGLAVYVVLAGGSMVGYVVYRNGRVEPEQKVLTPEHLSNAMKGKNAKPKAHRMELTHPPVEIQDCEERPVPAPSADMDPGIVRGYEIAQDILYDVAWRRVSEAALIPSEQQTRVRLVIDGVATDRTPLTPQDAETFIQYIKPLAGMDPEQRRQPQEGRIFVAYNAPAFEVTVKVAGTTGGQQMHLRVTREVVRTKLEELGLADDTLERVRELATQRSGLMIASGPKRNGVTSTLYALLREQDAFTKQLVSVEETPEIDLENITQNVYETPAQQPEKLSAAFRRDPDVIMVDRIASEDTPEILRDVSAEKMAFLGINAPDAFTALAKWVKLAKTPQALDHLHAVLCQVLLRKLCPACREAYRPDPQLLAKVNLPADRIQQFHRPPSKPLTDEKGNPITCPTCQGSGYVGRTGAFELLEVTDEIRQLVAEGGTLSQLRSAARKNKMLYLQEQLLRKVIEGVTSIQEIIRVQQQGQQKSKG
jgi:type II secretory ATPase GspE/PulE/Tfp pilus assembly ATPase PilB-like protein